MAVKLNEALQSGQFGPLGSDRPGKKYVAIDHTYFWDRFEPQLASRARIIGRARSDKRPWRAWQSQHSMERRICKLQILRGGRWFESHPHRQFKISGL